MPTCQNKLQIQIIAVCPLSSLSHLDLPVVTAHSRRWHYYCIHGWALHRAMIASPLMIGADMRDIAPEFRAVWLNKELIRVNQVSTVHK